MWSVAQVWLALRLFNYLRCGPEHTQQPKAKFRASMRDETRSLTTAPPPRRCSLPPRLEPTRHPSALRPLISPRTWPTPRPAPRACTTTARSPAGSPEIDLQWEMLACNYSSTAYGPISHCDVSDVTDVTSGARDCSRCARRRPIQMRYHERLGREGVISERSVRYRVQSLCWVAHLGTVAVGVGSGLG